MAPIIRKGDLITCLTGHVIGEALRDVSEGDMNWGDAFGNWRQSEYPKPGDLDRKPVCAICGSRFIAEHTWQMHFAVWRP